MTTKNSQQLQVLAVPDFGSLVLRAGGYESIIRWDCDTVDVLLVSDDRVFRIKSDIFVWKDFLVKKWNNEWKFAKISILREQTCGRYFLGQAPNLQARVLTDGSEESSCDLRNCNGANWRGVSNAATDARHFHRFGIHQPNPDTVVLESYRKMKNSPHLFPTQKKKNIFA